MAENENLDLLDERNRGWVRVSDALASGRSAAELAQLSERALRSTLRGVFRNRWTKGPEFPVGELMRAASGVGGDVKLVLRKCANHDLANLMAELSGNSESEVAAQWCSGIFERFFDQITHRAVGRLGNTITYEKAINARQSVWRALSPAVREIAHQIASNPGKPPKAAPRSSAQRQKSSQSLLKKSLLNKGGRARE